MISCMFSWNAALATKNCIDNFQEIMQQNLVTDRLGQRAHILLSAPKGGGTMYMSPRKEGREVG